MMKEMALMNKSYEKYKHGQYEDSIEYFSDAINLSPKRVTHFRDRGNARYWLGHYEDAIKDYDEVIQLNSENTFTSFLVYNFYYCGIIYPYYGKASCYLLQKNIPQAIEYFNKVLDFTATDRYSVELKSFSRVGLHCISWLEGKEKNIISYFCNDILKNLPSDRRSDCRVDLIGDFLAQFYLTAFEKKWLEISVLEQSYQSILEILNQVISIVDTKLTLYYYRARVLLLKLNMKEAVNDLNKALEISPDYTLANDLLQQCKQLLLKDNSVQINDKILTNNYQSKVDELKIENSKSSIFSLKNDSLEKLDKLEINEPSAQHIIEEPRNQKLLSSFSVNIHYKPIAYDQLKFGKFLGEGGFGKVYCAIWNLDEVAVKLLKTNDPNTKQNEKKIEEQIEEFKQEMNLLAQLNHPHIVHFYGASVDEHNYALVMEYCPKGSLYNVIHNPKELLSWEMRTDIAIGVGKGIYYLHSQNFVHRDINSKNILLDSHYVPKLADFGISKTKTHSCYQTQSRIGQVFWMAPEFFTGEQFIQYSAQTDMYAYGMVLWELSARKMPYVDCTYGCSEPSMVIQCKQKNIHDKIPEDAPQKIAHLIQLCWIKEPKERPTPKEAVEHLLKPN